ncbi:MAG: DEAD/DEAH box helicase family protein [Lachnospiraceae bacterium]
MDIYLRSYQRECIENIFNKIESGETRISVAMTVGLGKSITSIFLADEIIKRYSESCVLVFRYRANCDQTKAEIAKLGKSDEIYCVTVNEFLHDKNQKYKYCLLHDLAVYDRKQISDAIKNNNVVTVSFFAPGQDVVEENQVSDSEQAKRLMAYAERITPIVCVYETKDILDIRDIRYAGEMETSFIKNEISIVSDWLTTERVKAEKERNETQNRINRLQAYMKAFKQLQDQQTIKNQAAEIERLKALLQADERDKRIEDLEAREKEYQEQLIEKDARIAQQDQMISFMKTAFSSIGISPDVIEQSFDQIQRIRESLIEELESTDEDVKEIALKKLQDKVAEIVGELTRNVISVADNTYYKEYLVGELTQDVWDKLDEKSKAFLITAKSNYDSMVKMPDKDSMDYSGVCLLVTKALEVETTKRFFDKYKEFLNRKYTGVSQWPYVLRKRVHGQVTDEIIPDGEFTLGSVVTTVGYKRDYDVNGNITGYSRGHNRTRMEFLDYATRNLFRLSDRSSAEREIEKDYQFIERVRLDYRNPSAHRDELTITSAKNCIEYVIDVHHMLKEMLGAMKI